MVVDSEKKSRRNTIQTLCLLFCPELCKSVFDPLSPIINVAVRPKDCLPGKRRFFFPSIEMDFKYNLLFLPGERAFLRMNPLDA